MKLIAVNEAYAEKERASLMKERQKGNMVVLCSEHNRAWLMHNRYMLANLFIADGGEFAFGGCHVLYEKRSQYLDTVISILEKEKVPHAFTREDPDACGGRLTVSVSDSSLSTEAYSYPVEASEKLQELLSPYCDVRTDAEGQAYLVFHDAGYDEAIEKCAEAVQASPVMTEKHFL